MSATPCHLAARQSACIVEKDGKVIAPFTGGRQVALPLAFIGFGAAERRRLRCWWVQPELRRAEATSASASGAGTCARQWNHRQAA